MLSVERDVKVKVNEELVFCYADVEDIKFVINYDYPNSSEDYVHRIGRTARSTNKGTAYTFFTPGNARQARDLVRVLQEANQAVSPQLLQMVESCQGRGGGRMRYRSSNSHNPNMMYQDGNHRRMRHGEGSGGGRGGRPGYGRGERTNEAFSSSYNDRSRDGRNSHSSDQYQSYSGGYNAPGRGQSASNGGMDQSSQHQGQFAQPRPPSVLPGGPRPLIAKQFASPQPPVMGFMGRPPYPFKPPPPGPSPR